METNDAVAGGVGIFGVIIYLGIIVLMIASFWKIFEKAGKPGWAAIVPIYNLVVLLEIVNKPTWWLVLFIIPIANIIVAILVYIELAKAFGKDAAYGVGLALLGIVFFPMLAFSDAQYQGSRMKSFDDGILDR